MRIGIIAAMRKEVDLLLPLVSDRCDDSHDGMEVTAGRIGNHEICVMECGIGKVNSALSTRALIENFRPGLIINTGVAGGVQRLDICNVLIADSVMYHDVWCGPGTEYGQAYGFPTEMLPDAAALAVARSVLDDDNIFFGKICSGDKFITSPAEIEEIRRNIPDALAVDMESASIAQTAMRFQVPFMIIRAISDTPGSGKNISQYENFWEQAPENTFEALSRLLNHLT